MSPSDKRQVLKDLAETRAKHELCPECSNPVVKGFDAKYQKERLFDPAPMRTGQFIVGNGHASWWGFTGGTHKLHVCPDRSSEDGDSSDSEPVKGSPVEAPTPSWFPLFSIDPDVPDPDEMGYGQPLRKRRPASAEKPLEAKR